MSVDAINAANPQQKQGSPVGAAVGAGVGLGLAGAAGGYFLGGKRPDLEKVFAMPADKFESATKDLKDAEKEAAEKLAAGRKELEDAVKPKIDEFKTKTSERARKIAGITPEKAELITNAEKANNDLTAKKVNIGEKEKDLTTVREELKEAKKGVKNLAKDADEATKNAAKERLTKAEAYYKAFKEGAKAELEAYVKAERELNTARVTKYQAEAAKDGTAEKALNEAIAKIRNEYKEAFNTKMNALKDNKEYQDAFGKIKKLFPKEGRGKAAMIYGGIAAAVGLVAGYIMGNSKQA
jgi:chromosome segregation ATPase